MYKVNPGIKSLVVAFAPRLKRTPSKDWKTCPWDPVSESKYIVEREEKLIPLRPPSLFANLTCKNGPME